MKSFIVGVVAAALLTASGHSVSVAQPTTARQLNTQIEGLIRGLEAQHQSALIKERRLADDRELRLIAEAEAKLSSARRAYEKQLQGSEEALNAARTEFAELITTVGSREASLRLEIDAYHAEVTQLAVQATPERRAALLKFADGDRVGAWPILESLRLAEDRAVEFAANVRRAVRWRDDADLREIMRSNNEATVGDVLELRQKAATLDPSHFWNQIELGRLLVKRGLLLDGWRAGEAAFNLAKTSTDKTVALIDMGDANWSAGYWDAARNEYHLAWKTAAENSDIDAYTAMIAVERFAANVYDQDQYATLLLRAFLRLSVERNLNRAAASQVLLQLPTPTEPPQEVVSRAAEILRLSLGSQEELLRDERAKEPASARFLATQMSTTLGQLGYHYVMQEKWAEAEPLLRRALSYDRENVAADPTEQRKSALSSGLIGLGDVLLMQGQIADAASLYDEAFNLDRELLTSDFSNLDYGMSAFTSFIRVGAVRYLQGDFKNALVYWSKAQRLIEAISQSSPDSRSDESQLLAINTLISLVDGGGVQ